MKRLTKRQVIGFLMLVAALVVFLKTAWISDDAKITFRTVLNMLHGYGPVFNIGERVQAYTHPLWFLLLTGFTLICGNIFLVSFALSICLSLGVVWFLLRKSHLSSWIWIVFLLFSKAFFDFSTSGLENPLSHFLLIIGSWHAFQFIAKHEVKDARWALMLFGSTYLCRPDLVLIVIPLAIYVLAESRDWKTRRELMFLAILPGLLWSIFSLGYYGFLFPNTAYAKLENTIPQLDLFMQGWRYYAQSFAHDPMTMTLILVGLVYGLFRTTKVKMLSVGIALYLLYVFCIGGDFMSGRFLTVPLVCSVFILSQSAIAAERVFISAFLIAIVGFKSIAGVITTGSDYKNENVEYGIADERGFYFQTNGLINLSGKLQKPDWKIEKKNFYIACGLMGELGLKGGPGLHIIDNCGLADPLLARLAPVKMEEWRIGHFFRKIPENYVNVLWSGDVKEFKNSEIEPYWEKIRILTRDPIFSKGRLATILEMNTGMTEKPYFAGYDQIIKTQHHASIQHLNKKHEYFGTLNVHMDEPTVVKSIDFHVYGNSIYWIRYMDGNHPYNFPIKLNIANKTKKNYRINFNPATPAISEIILDAENPAVKNTLAYFRINAKH